MKVQYNFVNDEKVEVEVTGDLELEIKELDRQQYNNDHKETRRHTSLDSLPFEGEWFAEDNDLFGDLVSKEQAKALREAIETLGPTQKSLLCEIFYNGKSAAEIARMEGVSKAAIHYRLEVIYKKLRQLLMDNKWV